MIVLTEATDNLQAVLGGSVTTNQMRCYSSWRDITTTAYTPGRTVTNTNNTTDVNVVPAPGGTTQRVCDYLSIFNADTVSQTLTVKFDANGTEYTLWSDSLASGERLEYADGTGFRVFDNNGLEKTVQVTANSVAAVSTINVVTLGSDVVNNNATLNTIADVTGLSFSVTSGERYWFQFEICYTSAATTTGSRWSVSGPGAPTYLVFRSEYTLAATTITTNANLVTYDLPAASNATSSAGLNRALIEGFVQPSADGTFIARCASEVANSAVTALAGSHVKWMRVL